MTPQSQEYRTITLTKGQVAIVDVKDYDWLMKYRWHAVWCPGTRTYYAQTMIQRADKLHQSAMQMHRLILGLDFGDPRKGDHLEPSQTLDNRRCNLRIASHAGNMRNRRANRNTHARLKGVSWHSRDRIYEATIRVNGKLLYLGRSTDAQVCHQMYRKAALVHFGEFARFE